MFPGGVGIGQAFLELRTAFGDKHGACGRRDVDDTAIGLHAISEGIVDSPRASNIDIKYGFDSTSPETSIVDEAIKRPLEGKLLGYTADSVFYGAFIRDI